MIDLGFDASAGFHTYAFEWRPDSIRWFVDGRQVHEETGARGPLPSHPGKIFLHAWAGKDLEGWLGRLSYPGHPLVAEIDCVAFRPLASPETSGGRSEERSVGIEGCRTRRSSRSPYPKKKK